MKILLLNQTFYPDNMATAQHATDLALFLVEQGHDVTVVTGRRGYEERTKIFPKEETYRGVKIFRVNSTGFGKLTFLRRVVDAITFDFCLLMKLVILPKFDVTICLTSPPLISVFGRVFRFLKGGDLVQWLMDINPEAAIAVGYLREGSVASRILLAFFRWSLRGSDRIVVLDRWMKDTVKAHHIEAERIVVVPPWPVQKIQGIPSEVAGDPQNPFRQKFGLGTKFVVLYSGNHSIVHPLDTLLESARLLKDDDDIRFVFVGGGLRVIDVTKFMKEHDLKNIVQAQYQPLEILQHSLAMANLHVVVMGNAVTGLVHASKVYGILASGRPYVAISPKNSHLCDQISACPYGFHVEHGDASGLVKVILKAKAMSQNDLKEIAEKNFNYMSTHYTRSKLLGTFHRETILALSSERGAAKFAPSEVKVS